MPKVYSGGYSGQVEQPRGRGHQSHADAKIFKAKILASRLSKAQKLFLCQGQKVEAEAEPVLQLQIVRLEAKPRLVALRPTFGLNSS